MALRAVEQTSIIEDVVAKGDLKALTSEQRARYYTQVCESMGLNPMTEPFQYIVLNGKLKLYATKGATDQLRKIHGIGIRIDGTNLQGDIYCVTVTGTDAHGRTDSDIGAINVKGLQGDNLANAMMKAITKAKRRVTMSMCGLGMLDESEVEAIPQASRIHVDASGVIVEPPFEDNTPQIAPESTEGDVTPVHGRFDLQDPFDDRLADAVDEKSPSERKQRFSALYSEAVAERDTDKLRKIITFHPNFEAAEAVLNSAANTHNLNDQAMIDALANRTDNPNRTIVDKDAGMGGTMTDLQRRTMFAIQKEIGMTDADLKNWIKDKFDIDSRTQLSEVQAKQVIDMLRELQGGEN